MATIEASGHPFASLVGVATAIDGTPLLLLSRLARHTRNLNADARASLLVEGVGAGADPLAEGRVTVVGKALRVDAAKAARRFLARNPASATYVDFADFGFFELVPERVHLVAGFGRIHDLPADEVLIRDKVVENFAAAEQDLITDLTVGNPREIAVLAQHLGGGTGDWRIGSIDPDGCDLVAQDISLRWAFSAPLESPDMVGLELTLAAAAASGGATPAER